MIPDEMRVALTKMLDDFWHKEDIEAAYAIYSDDVVFQRIPFPPMVGKAANMQADAGMLAAFSDNKTTVDVIWRKSQIEAIPWCSQAQAKRVPMHRSGLGVAGHELLPRWPCAAY
jgi:hypothetical protein